MNPEQLKELTEKLTEAFDPIMEEKLKQVLGPMVTSNVKNIVEGMRVERALYGHDRSGLTEDAKIEFAKSVKSLIFNGHAKANEALIEEQDNRGGYLVSRDVAAAVQRIAASVGLIMSQAQKWPMSTDELDIPNYTGAFLTGEYLGVDASGSDTGLTFGQSRLVAKIWQLSFAVSKALLADASVNLADWLLALAGESLANVIDKQGLTGNSDPFVGVLNDPNVNVTTVTGTTFALYKVIDDSSTLIASVAKSARPGSIFVMSDTVWGSLRVQKDSVGAYLLPQAGAASNRVLSQFPSGSALVPDGEILGYPVHTSLHLPALSATASATKFIIFGNFKAFAYGEKGSLEVEQFSSGSFGGKEVAKSYQRGIVYNHRHGLVSTLSAAFAVAKTT